MFSSTLLDDPLLFDACPSFDGGVVSNRRADLLARNQLASLINGDITRTGQIVTRRGTRCVGGNGAVAEGRALPIQGLTFLDSPAGGSLVAAAGGALWHHGGTGGWSPLGGGGVPWRAANALVPVAFARGADRLFFTDGVGSVHAWNGVDYQDLGAVSPDPDRRPPVGRLLAWHGARLCVAGVSAVPDAVYFSDPLLTAPLPGGPPWNHPTGHVRAGGGEGDAITALVPWSDFNLIVFKRHSTWIVNTPAGAADPAAFPVNPIHRRVGCVAGRTAVQVGADVWFLAADGVRSLRRTQGNATQQEIGDTISFPVHDLIERINPAAAGTSCAVCWNGRFLLAVPLDGASAPNAVLVCNTLTQTWTGHWLGWRPLDWVVSAFGGNARLCFGQVDGTVREWLDYLPASAETPAAFTDAGGAPVLTVLRTRALNFGDAHGPKSGFNYEVEFNASQAQVDVRAVLDDSVQGPGDTLLSAPAARPLPLPLPCGLPRGGIVRRTRDLQRYGRFRALQFDVASTGGKLALRSISASAFDDPAAGE